MFFDQTTQILLLVTVLIFVSGILLFRTKRTIAVALIFVGSCVLGYTMATLDPFLNLWDEQFHALVAKNMMHDPFRPTLYPDALLDYDIENWTANYIWVHKQPLFLWQIALSFKLFGANVLALRLPSILMHALISVFIYRIGKIALNDRIGFIAALLFAVAHFPLEILAAKYSTDHNDLAFLFYVTASFWSFWEYRRSGDRRWILLIGLFSGGAVLVKWLLGLLIYPSWFISIFLSERSRFNWRLYIPVFQGLFISFLVFLPWQFYIFSRFPAEAGHEFEMISRHLNEVIEGHGEERFYFLKDGLIKMYGGGLLMPYILLFGFILLIIRLKNWFQRTMFIAPVVIVYSLYTYAETKMPGFPMVVIIYGLLSIAAVIFAFFGVLKCLSSYQFVRTTIGSSMLIFIMVQLMDISKIEENHTYKIGWMGEERKKELFELKAMSSLEKRYGKEEVVFFNANYTYAGHIPIMFHTDYIAYSILPSESDIERLKLQGKRIVVFDGELPEMLRENEAIEILNFESL